MNRLTRREFLELSAVVSAGTMVAACQPITRPMADTQAAPAIPPDEPFAAFDEEVKNAMTANEIPGIAVGVIQDNALVYENGFGVRNLDTGDPMTSRSVMSMASVSKAFTAAAIMQLIETGKMRVEDSFVTHVPYFEMEDPRYKDITVRHLLAHNSGMPELTPDMFFSEWDDPWTDEGAAERYVRSFKTGVMLNQEPGGDQFRYSDFGYDILADLIHKVSGELFEDYCHGHFFEPLQMNDSTFLFSEIAPEALVAAHIRDEDGTPVVWDNFPYDRKHAPSSCLHSNVVDMSNWALAHMNHGELNGNRILQPKNQAQLWEVLFPWGGEDALKAYGWGWELGDIEGEPLVTSFGGQPGVQTVVALLPEKGLGVIVLGNILGTLQPDGNDPYVVGDLAFWALDKLLKGEIG